jgi:hypothetical protein
LNGVGVQNEKRDDQKGHQRHGRDGHPSNYPPAHALIVR